MSYQPPRRAPGSTRPPPAPPIKTQVLRCEDLVYEANKRKKVLRKTTESVKVRVSWLGDVVHETHPAPFANDRHPWTWHDTTCILFPLNMDNYGGGGGGGSGGGRAAALDQRETEREARMRADDAAEREAEGLLVEVVGYASGSVLGSCRLSCLDVYHHASSPTDHMLVARKKKDDRWQSRRKRRRAEAKLARRKARAKQSQRKKHIKPKTRGIDKKKGMFRWVGLGA